MDLRQEAKYIRNSADADATAVEDKQQEKLLYYTWKFHSWLSVFRIIMERVFLL